MFSFCPKLTSFIPFEEPPVSSYIFFPWDEAFRFSRRLELLLRNQRPVKAKFTQKSWGSKHVWKYCCKHTMWALTGYKWGYSPHKWPHKYLTGVVTLLIKVMIPLIASRGPPCISLRETIWQCKNQHFKQEIHLKWLLFGCHDFFSGVVLLTHTYIWLYLQNLQHLHLCLVEIEEISIVQDYFTVLRYSALPGKLTCALENQWLEDVFPIEIYSSFLGSAFASFPGCTIL